MSSVFQWRDTTIIILAVICNIIAQFSIALNSDIVFLYLAYVLWMLWNSITTLTRSSITKFLDSHEVGRAFSVLGTLQAVFPLITNPFISFIYKITLETIPGAFRIWRGSLYFVVLFLLIYIHLGLRREKNSKKTEEPKELTDNSKLKLKDVEI